MSIVPDVTVLDIQRMSTEDGPGLRTTVFLKGCNLKCRWCHNPDSIDAKPLVQWEKVRCIGCGSCRTICPSGALQHLEEGIFIDRNLCNRCFSCSDCCPSGAINKRGLVYECNRLLQDLLKDKAYFGQEGGITLSGGEPLLQHDAALWLLSNLKKEGLGTALDTAGLIPLQYLLESLEHTDLLLYDLKCIDSATHRRFTGSDNRLILHNLVSIASRFENDLKRLWIRTPLIPGATANGDTVESIGSFIAEHLGNQVEKWELCAFNNLCEHKYEMLGWQWPYKGIPLMSRQEIDELTSIGQSRLADFRTTVQWSGRAAAEQIMESGDNNDQ